MSDYGFEEFQDLALCPGLLIAIIKTTLLTRISIHRLILHMQSRNLQFIYLQELLTSHTLKAY